jgi:hypothetical protein
MQTLDSPRSMWRKHFRRFNMAGTWTRVDGVVALVFVAIRNAQKRRETINLTCDKRIFLILTRRTRKSKATQIKRQSDAECGISERQFCMESKCHTNCLDDSDTDPCLRTDMESFLSFGCVLLDLCPSGSGPLSIESLG